MSQTPPKGLALTGSILAIIVGALMIVGGILIAMSTRIDEIVLAGIIAAIIGIPGVVLGAIGCSIKPGVILANAIIFSIISVLGIIGMVSGRPTPVTIISALLYITTTIFLYLGFAQASKYRKALQG